MVKYFSRLLFLLFTVLALNLFSQSPEAINYQAVARSLGGAPLVNTGVNVKFEIRQGSPAGTAVYSEGHSTTTNAFGLFTAEIGNGTPLAGVFSGINWGSGSYYLYVEVNGDPMGATQLLSVPYALYSKQSANGPQGLPGQNSLIKSTAEPAGVNCVSGGYFIETGLDANNNGVLDALEVQVSYYICNGVDGTNGTNGTNGTDGVGIVSTVDNGDGTFTFNYSDASSFTTSDLTGPAGANGTTYYPGNGIVISNDTIINNGDSDNDPSNELQVLSIVGDTLFLSNGNSVQLPSASGDIDWTQGTGVIYNTTDFVGIGTTTPTSPLTIDNSNAGDIEFVGTGNSDITSNTQLNISSGNFATFIEGGQLGFFTGSNERLSILNNGNVGVGNNAPTTNLDISGRTKTDSITISDGALAGAVLTATDAFGNAEWQLPSSTGDGWGADTVNTVGSNIIGNGTPGSPLQVIDNDTSATNELQVLTIVGDTLFLSNGNQVILPSNTDTDWLQGSSIIYNLNDSIGIGTTLPNGKLEINGNGIGAGNRILKITQANQMPWAMVLGNDTYSTNDNEGLRFSVQDDGDGVISTGTSGNLLLNTYLGLGNVGIGGNGAIVPTSKLHIFNGTLRIDDGIKPYSLPASDSSIPGDVLTTDAAGNTYWAAPVSSSFWTQNGDTLHPTLISSKVGVGTTTPISNFQIGPQLHLDSITGPGGFNYNIYSNNLLYNGSNWVRTTNGTGIASYMGGYEYGIELYGNGAAGSNATSITAQFTIDSTRARITTKQDGLTITNESDTSLYLQSNASNNPTIIFNNQGWSTGLRSSSTPSSNLLFSLPNNHGNPGEIMSTDGFGNMSWIAPSSGSLWTDASPNIYYNSGNVGIGTGVSPQGKLSILHNGNVSSPGIYMENPNNGAASGLNRISMFNSSVTNKFWEMAAGVNTGGDAISAWTVSYDNGSTYDQLLAVYGDKKIAVGNISAANSSTFDVFGTTTMHDALTIDNGSSNPYTFPVVDGTISGQVLTTDALGNVTWQSPAVATTFWNGSAGAVYPSTISDKVGIGTATPNANLHVYGANPTMFIQDSQTTSAAYPSLQLGNTDGIGNFVTQGEISIPGSGDYMQIGATDAIRFNTNFSERMVISNTGNVGIGLSSPTARLEVLGNTDIQAQIRSVRAAGSTAIFGGGQTGGYIGTLSNHEFKIMTNSTLAATYSSSGNYSIGDNVTNKDWAAIQSNTSQDKRALFIQSTGASIPSATIQTGNAGGFALSIPQGRVKIGTGTPTANLDLSGTFKYVDGNQGTGKILTSDANGNATWKEKKIAFYVGGGGSNNNSYVQSLTQGVKETLQFDQSISAHYYNDGNGYNSSTFHFKAPVAGVYKLHADIALAGAQVGYYYMEMMHSSGNGITSQEGFFNSVHQNRLTRTLTATVHLNAGDEVWIEYLNTTGGSSFYMANSSFSGHLVYAD